jgi:hypothetical protein
VLNNWPKGPRNSIHSFNFQFFATAALYSKATVEQTRHAAGFLQQLQALEIWSKFGGWRGYYNYY